MITVLLVGISVILLISYLNQRNQLKSIIKQLNHQEIIKITLNNQLIEELASSINQNLKQGKRMQQDVVKRENQLKESIAHLSHDLRTPLTAMQGYLTLLKDCHDEDRDRYLSIIESKTHLLQRLIHQYYELSILEDHTHRVELERVDLTSVVTEIVIGQYALFEEKNISPDIELVNEPIHVIGIKSYCERIIQNLMMNAIKYSTGDIKISLVSNQEYCTFEISNRVNQMKETDLTKLFDKFYMVDQSRSQDGTGLGLYIVKLLLEKIEGEILEVLLNDNIFTIRVGFKVASEI